MKIEDVDMSANIDARVEIDDDVVSDFFRTSPAFNLAALENLDLFMQHNLDF